MQASTAPHAAWRRISDADPTGLDAAGIATLLSSLAAVRRTCDAIEVQAVRRTRELNAAGASAPPENVLANETGRSGRDARTASKREQACAAIPDFETGLADGNMSAGHVDAAASVHARLSEAVAEQFAQHGADLAQRAGQVGVDAFERECKELARHLAAVDNANAEADELRRQREASEVKRWVDRSTGMHKTLISLDPLRDATVWKAINAQLARDRAADQSDNGAPVSFAALQAGAVVNTILATRSDSSRRSIPEISVLIDFDVLVGDLRTAGYVCETDDGTPLPVSVVRQMAVDADIIPVVLGSAGEVLDQGRKHRTATPEQRTALAAMHATCAFPTCTVDFTACRIHHIHWWFKHRGPTDLDNLLPLCERHHHLVHEDGWGLDLDQKRIATWKRPDGALHHRGTTINRRQPSTAVHRSDRRPRDVPPRK